MSEPICCLYCGAPWDGKRMDHAEDCSILTGVYKTLGRKKRPERKPETKSWLDDDPGPKAA